MGASVISYSKIESPWILPVIPVGQYSLLLKPGELRMTFQSDAPDMKNSMSGLNTYGLRKKAFGALVCAINSFAFGPIKRSWLTELFSIRPVCDKTRPGLECTLSISLQIAFRLGSCSYLSPFLEISLCINFSSSIRLYTWSPRPAGSPFESDLSKSNQQQLTSFLNIKNAYSS